MENESLLTCPVCGASYANQFFFYCPVCGALNPRSDIASNIVCDLHPEEPAIGFCVVCGMAVCKECAETTDDKILCNNPSHLSYFKEWKIIYKFDFDYEAAMLYANLEQRGIETQVFAKLNPDTTQPERPTVVEVLVKRKDEDAANAILRLLGLDEEEENEI
jgi:hypothetical protein